jgi:hypothetical protein
VPPADEPPAEVAEVAAAVEEAEPAEPVHKPGPRVASAVTGTLADPVGEPADGSGTPGVADRIQRPLRVAARRPTFGAGPGPGGDEREAERGLRGLVGSGSSQVSVGAAMRARDAARPTAEQFADAEDNLPIVRRNWMPREDLPRNR